MSYRVTFSDRCTDAFIEPYKQGLVDHHARVGQAEALALGASRQQEGAMLAAWPMHSVDTSGLMNCMVS